MNLRQAFSIATSDPENIVNGELDWDFVDADCYLEAGEQFKTSTEFYAEFDALCVEWEETASPDQKTVAKKAAADADYKESQVSSVWKEKLLEVLKYERRRTHNEP
tara:strand:- start:3961 stop:4278 length:318 start_codon:yes stop_codon:yes gene_type:complete